MARGFKQAQARFIDDTMFQIPMELMYKTLLHHEEGMEKEIEKIDAFDEKLKTENLKTDNPEVNERLGYYRDKMGEFSQGMLKDAVNYGKYRLPMSALSKELAQDFNEGLIGRAQQNKADLDEWVTGLGDLKNVGDERKQLAEDVVRKEYKGLQYKNPNEYNAIRDNFINLYDEFDEDAFINETASNFTPDQTSTAYSGADGKGYIQSGSETIEIRSEADVESYVTGSLADGDWERQKRQLYELRARARGEEFTKEEIDRQIEKDRNSIIARAKNKLGYQKKTKTRRTTADSTYNNALNLKARNKATGEGVILEETRDPRNYTSDEVANFNETWKTVVKATNGKYSNVKELYNDVFKGPDTAQKKKDLRAAIVANGGTYSDFVDYMNYEYEVENLYTPHKDGYDPTNPVDVAEQQSELKALVTGINNMNVNAPIKGIRVTLSDGTTKTLDHKTVGGLIEDNEGYVYIPVTSTTPKKTISKNPAGFFLDADGEAIVGDEGTEWEGQPFTSLQQLIAAGVEDELTYELEQVPNYDTTGPVFKATTGNIKQNKSIRLNTANQVKHVNEYNVSQQYYKTKKGSNKVQVVNAEAIIDHSQINIKR